MLQIIAERIASEIVIAVGNCNKVSFLVKSHAEACKMSGAHNARQVSSVIEILHNAKREHNTIGC